MTNQKMENLLNLALSATKRERERSLELDVGYVPAGQRWELIVKHSGSLASVRALSEEIEATELLGNFGVLLVPEELIETVANLPEIEYVEKPKRLFFAMKSAKAASCLTPVQTGREALFGEEILMGIVDSGIDIRLPEWDGRILYLLDQVTGLEYSADELAEWLQHGEGAAPGEDVSGHGTAVAAIAAGNSGVARKSELIIVKLAQPRPDSFPRTTQLMTGVDFIIRKAMELGRPAVVNVSFGMNYGSHTGDSLLEAYLNTVLQLGRFTIVAGTGNEGAEAVHTSGSLAGMRYGEREEVLLAVGRFGVFFKPANLEVLRG